MSKHSITKPKRRNKSGKRQDSTADTMAKLKKLKKLARDQASEA